MTRRARYNPIGMSTWSVIARNGPMENRDAVIRARHSWGRGRFSYLETSSSSETRAKEEYSKTVEDALTRAAFRCRKKKAIAMV